MSRKGVQGAWGERGQNMHTCERVIMKAIVFDYYKLVQGCWSADLFMQDSVMSLQHPCPPNHSVSLGKRVLADVISHSEATVQ